MSDPRAQDPFAELFGADATTPTAPADPNADTRALDDLLAAAPSVTPDDLDALFGSQARTPGDELFGEAIASDVGAGALTGSEAPSYAAGEDRESGLDARGLLAEIDTSGSVMDELFGDAPVSPEVAAVMADPTKIIVRTVSATVRDDEKVIEEIAEAPKAPGRLSRFWHWTLGWPARPHDPRYVLPRLVRRIAVVGGLPLLLAAALGLSGQGTLFPESGSGSFGLLWTSGFGTVKAANVPVVTIDGIAVEAGAAAEAARLTGALWPALLAAGTGEMAPLEEIATAEFVAAYPSWLASYGLEGGRFEALDAQLGSGRGVLMAVDIPEAPMRLTVASSGGFATVRTSTAAGPYYIGSLRLTVVRLESGAFRIEAVELLR
jgi:hypothetical protein